MSNCSNHKKELFGQFDMKHLAEDIGSLHYESLAQLLYHLSKKIHTDADKDYKAGREKLAASLQYAGMSLFEASLRVEKVWEVCKPFMPNNPLYLRNVITEGPDKGYAFAVEAIDVDGCPVYDVNPSLFILVHPSYLENHKVGWMPDDWEEGYEAYHSLHKKWMPIKKEYYDILTENRRKVILPRSSNVEDAREETDEFVQKHLKIIKEKMKDSFIHQHIGSMFGNVSTASITYFLETGSINGNFRMALLALIDDVMKWQSNLHPPATHPNKERDRVEKEAELAKAYADSRAEEGSEIHETITNSFIAGCRSILSTRGKDAVEFVDWVASKGWIRTFGETWKTYSQEMTTADLYQLFLTSKPTNP